MLRQGENGEMEQNSASSSSAIQWSTASTSPSFGLQTTLSADPSNSSFNRPSSQIIIPSTSGHAVISGKLVFQEN